ncbi:cytochrome P450 [Actinobacteria bacterium YIM 96077]|uniref:Cytochrome P450 n=1 Tax=Phytoactinopolyspora halophila TaxID=1981511 RepID=A0A329QQR2_9ACTN|nr:cytochrome P450 [Phytoactinopolyspora halophila]AYY11366.1 cytochrome P450 [Actinobacteria bacterium YIM 96077]RAW14684.1 cytochrome P450 [Phytoactinopolyspora halophila]
MAGRTFPFVGDLLAFGSDRLGYLTRVAREHGDVVRIKLGPYRCWVLSHPDDVRGVLVDHADRFRKGPVLQRARLVLGDGLLTAEGDVHRRHRSMVQPAFHSRRVAGYAETMIANAAEVRGSWTPGRPLDVHAETVRLTLASAGSTLLGADVEDDDVRTVESAVADLLGAYKLAFVPFGWRLQRLPIGPVRRLRRGREQLYRVVDRVIEARQATAADAGDLLSALIHPDDGELSAQQIRDHAVTLLLAGHETTANALAFACHLLAHDPETEQRVHAEVDEILDQDVPRPDDANRLPLCRAVMSEALRLYPPSWMMAREAVDDHRAGDHIVRAGDLVLLPQWVVHRDSRWWFEPDEFRPDRWLDASSKDRPRWAYFPFGAGIRRCIGEGFAWTEGVLALATITRRWELRPVLERPLALDPLLTLRPRGGLWLRPEPRPAR